MFRDYEETLRAIVLQTDGHLNIHRLRKATIENVAVWLETATGNDLINAEGDKALKSIANLLREMERTIYDLCEEQS